MLSRLHCHSAGPARLGFQVPDSLFTSAGRWGHAHPRKLNFSVVFASAFSDPWLPGTLTARATLETSKSFPGMLGTAVALQF